MNQTIKLCSIANCVVEDELKSPCKSFNPCSVFRHIGSGQWYYESDATKVVSIVQEDGSTFDAQEWLESMYSQYLLRWKPGSKVCQIKAKKHKLKPSVQSSKPKYTAQELDMMVDTHTRNIKKNRKRYRQIQCIENEISVLKRFKSKYGVVESLQNELNQLEQEVLELKKSLGQTDDNYKDCREYAEQEYKWANKWVKPKGKTGDFAYLCSINDKFYEVNRNGITLNGEYVYLTDYDMRYFESFSWAESNLNISRDSWIKVRLDDELISSPIKSYGKKNANGARIQSRFEQKRYQEIALKLKWSLVEQGVSMYNLYRDEELRSKYLKVIKDKLR